MKDNKITIEQVGYTYVFQVENITTKQYEEELRKQLQKELEEGCVVLPANVTMVSVEPRLKVL